MPAPSAEELQGLVRRIAERISRSLERTGLITRDIENAYLTFDPAGEAPISGLLGAYWFLVDMDRYRPILARFFGA